MEYINFKKSIETYADYVIKEARINLGKKDNQDGKLSTSLSYKINSTESAYIVRFFMENYGRFLPRKTLDFLIARSIFKKGIRATSFFSGPFTEGQKIFGDDFLKAIAKDIENRKQ